MKHHSDQLSGIDVCVQRASQLFQNETGVETLQRPVGQILLGDSMLNVRSVWNVLSALDAQPIRLYDITARDSLCDVRDISSHQHSIDF